MELKMRKTLLIFIIAVLTQVFTLGDARAATAMNNAVFVAMFSDSDRDGISDYSESALLAKYSPYYLFSRQGIKLNGIWWPATGGKEENYNPTDAIWYVRVSEVLKSGDEQSETIIPQTTLSSNPSAALDSRTDLTRKPMLSEYRLNPLKTVGDNSDNPGRHGQDWGTILAKRNVGLYGHVVPLSQPQELPPKPSPPSPPSPPTNEQTLEHYPQALKDYRQALKDYVQALNNYPIRNYDYVLDYETLKPYAGKTLYKIEYWQFFGYNNPAAELSIGDHEGDWDTVQLLYDPEKEEIVRVTHYVHGDPIFFSMKNATNSTHRNESWGQYEEHRGVNFGGNFNQAEYATAWHNTLRMLEDPVTHEFTHPVVYVENGSHEFWPTESGFYCEERLGVTLGCAPPHAGDDVAHRYLTTSVPNLGEVERPSLLDAAEIVLRFNGHWGAFSKKTDTPPGPSLHKQWTWPQGSPLRQSIGDDNYR